MSTINEAAVLNPFTNLTANIFEYVPRATTSEFGIVAIGSGINVDALGRIYLDTQEYSDRLAAIEAQASSSLATQQTEVAAAVAQVNLTQSQTITALTLEVSNLKTDLTSSITATQTDLINRADQLAQDVTDITQQLTQDKATFTQEIQDALDSLKDDAAVASALRTPRKIQGVDFDGTQDISLPIFTTQTDGLVPKRVGATTTKYLREDGTWVVPSNTTYALLTKASAEDGTATSANTISAKVLKEAIQYHAPTVTNIVGNAETATKLQTSRTISLTGGVTGSVSFDGSTNASIATAITGLGVANGIATLDSNGKVPSTQLPSYGEVSSVAGKTGVVTLSKADVGLANVDNTPDTKKPISEATQVALNDKVNKSDVISVAKGGTGANSAADARANLGLGTASARNVGVGLGDVVTNDSARKAFGSVTIATMLPAGGDMNSITQGDYVFYVPGKNIANAPPISNCSVYAFRNYGDPGQLTVIGHDFYTGGIVTRGKQSGSWSAWAKHYHTLNTTINGNGYIVPSSPTIKIHHDSFELNEDSIKLGAVCEKLGVGHYEISNVDGFHQEGWYFDIPTDRYNNPLIAADYEYLPDARKIVIKAYAVKANTFPFEPDLDTPIDAPQGRWIDVRLYEPEWLNKPELPKPEELIVDNEGNTAPSRLHEFVNGVWVISDENAAILEQERLAAMKPLKRRQFRLTLAMNGYDLNEIEALIDQIEDPMQRTITQIEWQDTTDFERTNPTLLMMAELLQLTSEQIDQLWSYGLAL